VKAMAKLPYLDFTVPMPLQDLFSALTAVFVFLPLVLIVHRLVAGSFLVPGAHKKTA
jgi:hypothetical protein